MATNLWKESGERVSGLMEKYPDYKLVVTGHSLGGGTSCLLTVQLYVNEVFKDRTVECFAFAPPPTFWPCEDTRAVPSSCPDKIQKAIENTVAYIHDNDVVPFLCVGAVRRFAKLLSAVDSRTQKIWFWNREKIFHGFTPIPEDITESVLTAEKLAEKNETVEGECPMIIPAHRVIWMKEISEGRFEAFGCDPFKVARGNIFLCPDMLLDHLPEQYENALDALLENENALDASK